MSTTFTEEQLSFIQVVDTDILAAAARGELDLNRLAEMELASRGLDLSGQWIGFSRASKLFDSKTLR